MCTRKGGKYLSRLVSKGEHGFLSLCIIRLWFRPRALSDRERRRRCLVRLVSGSQLPRHPIQRASLFRPSIFPSLLRSRVDHLQRNTTCGKLKQKAETLTSDRLPSPPASHSTQRLQDVDVVKITATKEKNDTDPRTILKRRVTFFVT